MSSSHGLTYVFDPTEPGGPVLRPLPWEMKPYHSGAGPLDVSFPRTQILPGIRLKSLWKPLKPLHIVKSNTGGPFNTDYVNNPIRQSKYRQILAFCLLAKSVRNKTDFRLREYLICYPILPIFFG